MTTHFRRLLGLILGLALLISNSFAQTSGSARLEVTLLDYNGSGANHYCVAWVATASGTFIKSLRKQGPSSWTSSQWNDHCAVWNTARNGNTVLDGYTSATATTYSGTNSPVILTWNCRDTNNNLMADGTYKFYVQYAENSGQGPHTTNGLSWTKGLAGATNTYANIAANFANMRVTWTPVVPATAPTITSAAPTPDGTVGVPYSFTCTATGSDPIRFSASNLPPGLVMTTAGVISGTPTLAGAYSGTITATNGTLPNATQNFTITIANPNLGFVGSATCAECHPDKYALLQQSIHSQMIRVGAGAPGVIHGDLRRPNAPNTNNIQWVMGGWFKGENYIRTTWAGSNWNYTVTSNEWNAVTGGYVNNLPERDWTTRCAGCHTTGFDPFTRTWSELNVGCEACHGPGEAHVNDGGVSIFPVIDRSAETCGRCHLRGESVAWGSFTNRQFGFPVGYVNGQPNSLQFIAEALSSTNYFYPDGTSREHQQQYLDINHPDRPPTKHYEVGTTCVSCHDPHQVGILSTYPGGFPSNVFGIKIYNNTAQTTNYVAWDGGHLWNPNTHVPIAQANRSDLCKVCHTTTTDHHVHQFTAKALAAPVTCADCHMPDIIDVDPATLRGAQHPHRFNTIKPEASMAFGPNRQPNVCTYRCHQGSGATVEQRAAWADSILTQRLTPLASAGQVRMVGTPNYQYAVLVSSNLSTWTSVSTNTASQLLNAVPKWGFEYTDPAAGSQPKRFYRTEQVVPAP